jgi:N utilization substance protein B
MSPTWQIHKPGPVEVQATEETPQPEERREVISHVVGQPAAPLVTQKAPSKRPAKTKKRAANVPVAITEKAAPVASAKKTGTRRRGREMAMQMLFQADIGKQTPDQVRNSFWNAAERVDPETRGFAEDLFRVATTREEEIDALIEAHSANWRLPRMAAVDRNLLRAATAELLGFPGTPVPIVINESLEIARRYSAPESVNFLNGVLDAISRSRK